VGNLASRQLTVDFPANIILFLSSLSFFLYLPPDIQEIWSAPSKNPLTILVFHYISSSSYIGKTSASCVLVSQSSHQFIHHTNIPSDPPRPYSYLSGHLQFFHHLESRTLYRFYIIMSASPPPRAGNKRPRKYSPPRHSLCNCLLVGCCAYISIKNQPERRAWWSSRKESLDLYVYICLWLLYLYLPHSFSSSLRHANTLYFLILLVG
jgi:hypothetical protein